MKIRGISIYKPKSRSRKSDPWLISYGPRGARKVVSASTDKNITIELASKLARTLERVRVGLASQDEVRYETQALRPITDHLAEYEAHLIHNGRTAKHAKQMREYAEKILTAAGVRVIGDMVPSLLQREVARLEDGNATKNRHVAAVRAFLTWGFSDVRWPKAVPESVRLTKLAVDPERFRRVLGMTDLGAFIFAAETGGMVENVDGPTRSLIYRFTLASGLRANEVRTLLVSDLRPTGVSVFGKNQKRVLLALPAPLVAEMRDHAKATGRESEETLFVVSENLHRMVQADLKAAGLDYETAEGVFDFHALRHQCGAMLASAGLPAKSVQVHMRHASIRMTLDVYGHLFDKDADRTVETIANIGQHLAQRIGVQNSPALSTDDRDKAGKTGETVWSDGESNPDLLNAIQPSCR